MIPQGTRSSGPVVTSQVARELSPASYAFLQHYIRTESGIVVEEDKQYLLETRLTPVMKLHRLESLNALSTALSTRSLPGLGVSVIDAMTTNETLFFRDAGLFEAIRSTVLPAAFKRIGNTRRLRIWSAAASSGQEAYSLAMLLMETGKGAADFEIVATDLCSQVLDRARRGRYGQFEIGRGLPTNLLVKYFKRVGLEWEISETARKLVRFEQLDLRRDMRFLGNFDLILCRNVLIYFDTPTKAKILESLRTRLSPGGLLALGCAETIINIHSGFRRQAVAQSAFYCRSEEV